MKTKSDFLSYLGDIRYSEERRLVSEFWDDTCDQIVRDLADKYAWYIHAHDICIISDAISEYLPPETLKDFQTRFENLKIGFWKFALVNYGSMRLYQMGFKLREPNLLTCKGCGTQFLEWSISGKIAKKVNFDIKFCSSCYSVACWHGECANPLELPETEMLDLLRILCQKLETIPTISFMKEPGLYVALPDLT